MIATLRFIVDLTVAMGTVVMMLVTAAVKWRRKPYTRQEFSAAMERICRGVEELWRMQDEVMFVEPEALAANTEALRRLCRGMLRDMLRNTCYILERTEPCLPHFLRRDPRIESRDARSQGRRGRPTGNAPGLSPALGAGAGGVGRRHGDGVCRDGGDGRGLRGPVVGAGEVSRGQGAGSVASSAFMPPKCR